MLTKSYFTGFRTNASTCDMSTILPENVEEEVKQQAEISMGSEISDEDILNITHLCDQVSYSCVVAVQLWLLVTDKLIYCIQSYFGSQACTLYHYAVC